MRLIDADVLKQQIAVWQRIDPHNMSLTMAAGAFIREVDKSPTVDAVQVVRCCECKWHYPEYTGELMCTNCPKGQEEMFFCAGGMRRDGQTG